VDSSASTTTRNLAQSDSVVAGQSRRDLENGRMGSKTRL
jgi:hypothetical protein